MCLRRNFGHSAVSIPANIAEGFRKQSQADKARFLNIAEGSLEESRYYLILAHDLVYMDNAAHWAATEEIGRLLSAIPVRVPPPGPLISSELCRTYANSQLLTPMKAIEHVGQVCVDQVALVREACLLHDAPRTQVCRQREADDIGQSEKLESQRDDRPGQLRCQPLPPVLAHQGVGQLNFEGTPHLDLPQAAPADKTTVRPAAEDPETVTVVVPVLEIRLEEPARLQVGAEPAEGRHDPRILVHLAKLGEMVCTEALRPQATGLEGLDHKRQWDTSRKSPRVRHEATCRIIASSLAKSIGLVRWAVNPASRLRRMSSSMP